MLQIFLLGSFRVELDSKPVEDSAWARRKAKSLLKLLALQPGYRLHKEQALELLWPDLDLTAASSNLYRNLHLLRQTLQPGLFRKSESHYLLLKEEIIRLNTTEGVWVDVEAFENLLKRARTEPEKAISLLEEAISLYQGDLLEEDPYEEWVLLRREELRRYFYQALLQLATLYRQHNNYPAAITILQRILAKDQTNESAHRELILTYTLAGQRSEALNQYQLCTQILENELGLDPSPETLELYRQVLTGEIRAELPPVEPSPASPSAVSASPTIKDLTAPAIHFNNLPTPVTGLIGREEEIERAATLLLQPAVRLLTLTGPAGVGKTRIALQVATEFLKDETTFAQGICFVPLSSLTDPALLPLTIAEATGIREAGGQSPLSLLKYQLRHQQLLLVLDNFEQIIEAAGVLTELLTFCPRLKILVTSRAVLHLYGEHELVIHPLNLPASRFLLPLQGLDQSPAVALFIQRARAANPNFSLTAENAPTIVEICYRLDGLPLAIELVAAWIKLLTPEAILNRLDSWLHLLHNSARNLPNRQQSLQSALNWSYELLSEEERRLFARLGIFARGCTLEAIEAVCINSASPNEPPKKAANLLPPALEVLNQTAALIDKSLLYRQEVNLPPLSGKNQTLDTRFGMFEIIRDYALERLSDSGEEETLRERHLDYFLELVEKVEPDMHSQNLQPWLNRLELEHANLRELLKWSLAEDQEDMEKVEKGVRITGALAWFWHYRGYWSEGSAWVERALTHPKASKLAPIVHAKILYASGWMNAGQGNLAKANSMLEQSLALYRQVQDKWGITHTLDAMAEVARQQGNYDKAGPLYQTGLGLCNELDDQFCVNYQLIGLGYVNYQQGEYEKAQQLLKDGLASCWQLNDRYGAARALNGLGELLRRQGDFQQARNYYEQSLAVYRELGHTGNMVLVLHNLGQVELELKNYEKSSAYFKGGLILAYEIKSKRLVAWCLIGLAGVSIGQADPVQAAHLFGAAEAILETLGAQLDATNQSAYNRDVAALHNTLNETELRQAWATGRHQSIEQVISEVLQQGVFSFDAR